MKRLFTITLLILSSCQMDDVYNGQNNDRRFILNVANKSDYYQYTRNVYCDSFRMETTKKAVAYVDGIQLLLVADREISVSDNQYFKK